MPLTPGTILGNHLISGNALITGSTSSMATVDATGPGSFTIEYRASSGCVEGCGCRFPVAVEEATPIERITWSRIKAG